MAARWHYSRTSDGGVCVVIISDFSEWKKLGVGNWFENCKLSFVTVVRFIYLEIWKNGGWTPNA